MENVKILTRYIVKEVLKAVSLVLILLLTLFNLFTFSDELKDFGVGSYGLKEIFLYICLTSPRVIYELIPSAALLGSILVIGAMENNREIIAMRAAGFSVFWIIKSVMLVGVILIIISVLIGEFIAPISERTAQLIKTKTQNNKIILHSKYSLWLKEDNKFINIRNIQQKTELTDIYIFELDQQDNLVLITKAGKAKYTGNKLWYLQNIKQTKITNGQVFSDNKNKMHWNTSIDPDLLDVVVVKPDNMSLYNLFMYISFLRDNNQKSQTFELAFWSRLINPLVTLIMLMVSIPFVVDTKHNIGVGKKIMLGIIIGMAFNIFDKLIGHAGMVYNYNPVLMAVLPSMAMFCGVVYAVYRVN